MANGKGKHVPWRRPKRGQTEIEFLVEAIDDLSRNTGKWLASIVEAIATADPEEVKALTARAKKVADALEGAAKQT